ncbi:MAG: Transporter [Clostridium sp.]
MNKKLSLYFQIAAVFIGTVVGAGLASGQEISHFFTVYGYKSFLGIFICLIVYILVSFFIINISLKYNLKSYDSLISLVSPGILGVIINSLTTFFLIGSSSIILAGSGALIHQYFNISKWFGISAMILISLFVLFKDTNGLIKINSFIVPCLVTIIITLFILYIIFYSSINLNDLKNVHPLKSNWALSSLLYSGFNILCCSGVLVPLCKDVKEKKPLLKGVVIGTLGLTLLTLIINFLLMLNVPYIFEYEVPLLYIANRFGKFVQTLLLFVMWLEMFSTEVSDIYSVGKTLEDILGISYKKCVILVILLTIPISQIGFTKLISYLYPAFGTISLIFIINCLMFYLKHLD